MYFFKKGSGQVCYLISRVWADNMHQALGAPRVAKRGSILYFAMSGMVAISVHAPAGSES